MFRKLKTYELKGKLGLFEVDEYKNFFVVKKKLQEPSQKGFYDPTAFVVAKKDKDLPILPDREFVRIFGHGASFFFYHTGIRGKDHFKEEMKRIERGVIPIGTPRWWGEFLRLRQPKTA